MAVTAVIVVIAVAKHIRVRHLLPRRREDHCLSPQFVLGSALTNQLLLRVNCSQPRTEGGGSNIEIGADSFSESRSRVAAALTQKGRRRNKALAWAKMVARVRPQDWFVRLVTA